MAETAYDVLDQDYDTDEKVQLMVKYILGDDANLPDKIKRAKGKQGGLYVHTSLHSVHDSTVTLIPA